MADMRIGTASPRPTVPSTPKVETPATSSPAAQPQEKVRATGYSQQDTYEGASAKGASVNALSTASGAGGVARVANDSDDSAYDGNIIGAGPVNAQGERQVIAYPAGTDTSQVPGFEPRQGLQNNETLIYTNGVGNDVFKQAQSMQALADISGSRVIGVHNSTSGKPLDFIQAGGDKLLGGAANAAVTSLRDTILNEMRAGRDVHLVGHSQGALITSAALNQVKSYINRREVFGGPSSQEAEQLKERFNNIKVETFGGAAGTYPSGPQYVHYTNPRDPVNLVGMPVPGDTRDLRADEDVPFYDVPKKILQSAAGGPGSVVHFVNDDRGPLLDIENHDFDKGYLNNRVSFEDARQGNFRDRETRDLGVAGGPVETYDRNGDTDPYANVA